MASEQNNGPAEDCAKKKEGGDCQGGDCAECQDQIMAMDTESQQALMQECMGKSLENLSEAFKASAKRWEIIVYPSLLAFIFLAAVGFYLVYSLTKDVSKVAADMHIITEQMQIVASNMQLVSKNMNMVSDRMMAISVDVHGQSELLTKMSVHMQNMDASMKTMTVSMDHLRYSMAVMNNSVSRPMQFMNTFMPW